MKKLLLIATALLGAVSVMAGTDGATYDAVNGFTIQNKWIYGKNIDRAAYVDEDSTGMYHLVNQNSPNACIYGDYAVVGSSYNAVGNLCVLDLYTGEYLQTIALTLDGEQYEGTLCANTVGVDDYGNLYVGGYVATTGETPINVYTVDFATGELTQVAELQLPPDEADVSGRVDYFTIKGDITGAQDKAIFMCSVEAATEGEDSHYVGTASAYRWEKAQGSDEWTPGFNGYVSQYIYDTAPADAIYLGNCAWTRIIDDETFYIDGSWTYASLYDLDGTLLKNIGDAPEDLLPTTGTDGICEFSIGGKDFVAYSAMQTNDNLTGHLTDEDRGTVYICEFGSGKSFETMTKYWRVPEAIQGLGDESDGGRRLQVIEVAPVTDANGKEGVYLFTHKGYNGLGVYLMAEEGFVEEGSTKVESIDADIAAATISVAGKVITVSAEASDIAVYNLAGQKVAEVKNATQIAAPASGAYIVKAIVDGAAVVAKVIL